MRASTVVGLSVFLFGSVAAVAQAQAEEKAAKPATVVLPVVIKGRRPVPSTVDVSKMVMRAPLPELRKPLIDPSGNALDRDPF